MLDKTGTITQGKPVVTDIICDAGKNADKTKLLQIAGSIEKGSEHPLSEAIVNYCLTNNISLEKVTDFNALFGKGIEGTMSGTHYYAGNEKMMEEKGISLSTEQKNQDVYKRQGHVIGYVTEPTKYYSVEGSNLYFELRKDGVPVDPIEFFE